VQETARFLPLSYIPGGLGVYLTPLSPSTTTPGQALPPANNWHTKQFLICPHGLYLFLIKGAELLSTAAA
jgi:hypothetical protein